MSRHPALLRALFGVALCALAAPAATAQQGPPGGAPPPPKVTVATVKTEPVTLTSTLPGRVVASASAEVRPQVAGIITDRYFEEGGHVEAGSALYRIDPATYDAAVAVAKAAVAQAEAQSSSAQKDAARIDELASRNVSSDQARDQANAARDSAAANVQAAEAQLLSATIERDYTTIRARLSGEIGLSLASPGALVTASQADPLTVIRNIDPVYVDVTQSAAELLARRRDEAGIAKEAGGKIDRRDLSVSLILADGSTFDQTGTLTAAEPHVDEQTGVVVLRMTFANPQKLLLPGMYVQVNMPTKMLDAALVVPQQAVSRDRTGQATALVVKDDDTVEQRTLTVLQDRGSDWIVSDGLAPGDRVIVSGLQKAKPGAKVTPQDQADTPPPGEKTPTAKADAGAAQAPDAATASD